MIEQILVSSVSIPLSIEARVLLVAMILSLAASAFSILRNRTALRNEDQILSPPPFDGPSASTDNPILGWLDVVGPHLQELRQRVTGSLISIVAGTIAAALLTEQLLIVMAEPIGGLDRLIVIGVTENVSVFFRVTLTFGLILASPYILSQLWIFVAAGLLSKERRAFYLLFPFAALLFISGVAFAFFVLLPVTVPFLTEFIITAQPTLDDYMRFVTNVLIYVGLAFEMPLIVFLLAKLRIVNSGMLIKNWRFALVGIAILSAFVTPTPDPINMGIVAAPLVLLYILSVILAAFA